MSIDIPTRRKFTEWTRRMVFADAEENGPVIRFAVRHMQAGNKVGGEVGALKVKSNIETDDIDHLVSAIENICIADAEGLGGMQRYMIQPTFKETGVGSARFIVPIHVSDPTDTEHLGSEPPTHEGIATQMMRHTEALMRIHVNAPGQVIQQLQRIIARQQDQLSDYEEQRLKQFSLIEDLTNRKAERDMDMEKAAQRAKITGEFADKVMLLLPAAVNRITGKSILPETVTPESMFIKDFMKSITPEQMNALGTVFRAEQLMPLLQFYQKMQEEEQQKEQKKQDEG